MSNTIRGNNVVSVNGKTLTVPAGANVQVRGDSVYVNGKKVDEGNAPAREITVIVQGDAKSVSTENGSITVEGSAQKVETTNGAVNIGQNVEKSVKTGNGKVTVGGSIYGNVRTTNGNVAKDFR